MLTRSDNVTPLHLLVVNAVHLSLQVLAVIFVPLSSLPLTV